MTILITGGAGFIGFHLALSLKEDGHKVVCIDNFNDFVHAPDLKHHRADILKSKGIFVENFDIGIRHNIEPLFGAYRPTTVIHLAGHAGVRKSYGKAKPYIENNILATHNFIELCEQWPIQNLLYASTPEAEKSISPYGYASAANESQFKVSTIFKNVGMRLSSVYGPWGRPDMALFKFSNAMTFDEPINVYNEGDMKRDLIYIDDAVDAIKLIMDEVIKTNSPMKEIYSIGSGEQVKLLDFITEIENNYNYKFKKVMHPMYPAEIKETLSDITKLQELGWNPKTSIKEGIKNFCDWYIDYRDN